MSFTGKDLIGLGFEPGTWFKDALPAANKMLAEGKSLDEIKLAVAQFTPPPARGLRAPGETSFGINIVAANADEEANIANVIRHMEALMRVPTVVKGAIMPDACPAGMALGTIPVGGIVATEDAIHPGFHSADICCSMAISVLGDVDPAAVLNIAQERTHFGPGGRPEGKRLPVPVDVLAPFTENVFLSGLEEAATAHFGTQGDGNHFLYVGRVKSTGEVAIVTHHGSRKPGAMLYKRGLEAAEKWRRQISPETPSHSAWIPASDQEGVAYWDALQAIRGWTKANHFAIHDLVCEGLGVRAKDRFWNEHNFVFERDGLYYHAKGATPAWKDFAPDSSGLTLIPLNMAEPILITRGLDADNGLALRLMARAQLRSKKLPAALRSVRPSKCWRSRPPVSMRVSTAASPICRSCPAHIKTPRPFANKSTSSGWLRSWTRSCPTAPSWRVTGKSPFTSAG